MKKLKLSGGKSLLAIITTLTLVLTLLATPALASSGSTSGQLTGEGKVEFEPGGPDGSGGYVLIAVPEFDFGKLKIQSGTITQAETNSTPKYIKLEDLSGSPTQGWELLAKLSSFTRVDNSNTSLPGATILLNFTAASITSRTSTDVQQTVAENLKPTVAAEAQRKLLAGSTADSRILSVSSADRAARLAGAGRWWIAVTGTFSVAGPSATIGEHKATIDWTFRAVP